MSNYTYKQLEENEIDEKLFGQFENEEKTEKQQFAILDSEEIEIAIVTSLVEAEALVSHLNR